MASRELLIGLDVGSGSARCVLLDPEAPASPIVTRRGWRAMAAAPLDLDAIWRTLAGLVREALARAGGDARVVGLGVAGVRFGSVVVGPDGRVRFAAGNRDARAAGAAFELAAEHGETLHRDCGHWPTPILPVARARWLLATDPAVVDGAAHWFALNDWVVWRATGVAATDPSQAGASGIFELASGRDAAERIGAGTLPTGCWTPAQPAGSPIGLLDAAAATELGLPAGIPVASGGGDSQAALLGLGAVSAGDLGVACGTTAPVLRCIDPAEGFDARVWRAPHLVTGLQVHESNAGPVGESLAWLGTLLFPDAPEPAARVLAEAGAAAPGAGGLLSHFGAQVMDARALGLPVGELALSHLLVDAPDARAALCRAVAEGIAFALERNLAQAGAAQDDTPLRIGGGLARSAAWAQLVADVCARPVLVARDGEATGRGAALCAGVAAGVWADLRAAAADGVVVESVTPDRENAAALAPVRERWDAIRIARGAEVDGLTRAHAIQGLLSGAAASAGPAPARTLRILATAQLDPSAQAALGALGALRYESYREVGRLLQGGALVDALAEVDVFVTEIDLVDAVSLGRLPQLKAVAACRGDAVNIDVAACARLGIPVLHTPGRNADAVADLTLAFLLALARKLPQANAFLRDPSVEAGNMGSMGKAYGTLRGDELGGRTVGLVGLGAVGRKVAARLAPFGARLLVHDPWVDEAAVVRAGGVACTLERLLAESDFVSLHAAVTEASRGLLGREAIARMKPGAALVNTARAALVDEAALADALSEGHLAGAALDVFAVEPPGADHPLLAFDSVIATPHVGGNTAQVALHQGRIVAEQLGQLLAGATPSACLDPEVLPDFRWDAPPRPAPDAALAAWLAERPAPAVTDLQRDQKKPKRAPAAVAPSATPRPAAADPAAIGALEAVLAGFLERVAAEPSCSDAAAGKDLTLHFQVEDLGVDWYLRFRDGRAGGALGVPDAAAVQLRMAARTLDGMLGGAVNAAQEAMAGRIAFQGDATQAMLIQQLQGELERCWVAARDAAGSDALAGLPAVPSS